MQVIRQRYEDGYIYEYRVPAGTRCDPSASHKYVTLPVETVIRAFCDDEGTRYVTAWVPNSEAEVYATLFMSAAGRPDTTYEDSPAGEPEVLHRDERLEVVRERYRNGWLYSVTAELGFPWPSVVTLPALTPTRAAPIVAVEAKGTSYTTKYWVSDTAPYAPAA